MAGVALTTFGTLGSGFVVSGVPEVVNQMAEVKAGTPAALRKFR
jgi:hypothetical protein